MKQPNGSFWSRWLGHGEAPSTATSTPRTAFILLGGGAHGAAQAGTLAGLVEAGIMPDFLIGISAGALNGAFWACDPSLDRARDLEALWRATTTTDILGAVRWRAAVSAVTNRGTLYDAEGIRRIAERHLGRLTFDDLRLPLKILAVNVTRGEPVYFEQGGLLPAVLASTAIPGIFPPVAIDGEYYVDGGVADWVACETALLQGATTIYLLASGVVVGRDVRVGSLLGLLERSWEVAGDIKMRWMIRWLEERAVRVIPIQPTIASSNLLDFNQSEPLIQAGRLAAEKTLAALTNVGA